MSRPATGVDVSNLPRLVTEKEMADRTYQKYLKRLKTAYQEIAAAQRSGNDQHEQAWKEALAVLVERLVEANRPIPTLAELESGRVKTVKMVLQQKTQRQKEALDKADELIEMMKGPSEEEVRETQEELKARLDKLNQQMAEKKAPSSPTPSHTGE